MNEFVALIKELVPLLQTLLWICLLVGLAVYLRPEIVLLRGVFKERLERGSAFEIWGLKIGELRKELRGVRHRLDETNERITELFLLTMAPPMYENLRKIASGNFGLYEMSWGLERELYHLRDIGYIRVNSIQSIPRHGQNLSDYVNITESGKSFVELREGWRPDSTNDIGSDR